MIQVSGLTKTISSPAHTVEILKGVSIARERQRQGEVLLDEVRRARTIKRVRNFLKAHQPVTAAH